MKHFLRFTIACCFFFLGLLGNTYGVQANNVQEEAISHDEVTTHDEVHVEVNNDTTETDGIGEAIIVEEPPFFEQIIETANKLKGVKYRYSGSNPNTGFDCSGFTNYVFAQHGISLPRSSGDMYSLGKEVKRADLQPGDLVFFKTSGNKISHVGIYIGDNQFIHSSTSHGVITTNLNDPYYWSKRYVGAKRIL